MKSNEHKQVDELIANLTEAGTKDLWEGAQLAIVNRLTPEYLVLLKAARAAGLVSYQAEVVDGLTEDGYIVYHTWVVDTKVLWPDREAGAKLEHVAEIRQVYVSLAWAHEFGQYGQRFGNTFYSVACATNPDSDGLVVVTQTALVDHEDQDLQISA